MLSRPMSSRSAQSSSSGPQACLAEDGRVVRLRAPDGGLDTVLPDEHDARRATRGWQAKRHAGRIDWADCERSLDRAVDTWKPRRVTFTFPRALTRGEHEKFAERLGRRHSGVAARPAAATCGAIIRLALHG